MIALEQITYKKRSADSFLRTDDGVGKGRAKLLLSREQPNRSWFTAQQELRPTDKCDNSYVETSLHPKKRSDSGCVHLFLTPERQVPRRHDRIRLGKLTLTSSSRIGIVPRPHLVSTAP